MKVPEGVSEPVASEGNVSRLDLKFRSTSTFITRIEYSGRFYTACPAMETGDSGMMETAIPEIKNQ